MSGILIVIFSFIAGTMVYDAKEAYQFGDMGRFWWHFSRGIVLFGLTLYFG